jgi:hypothetical protein
MTGSAEAVDRLKQRRFGLFIHWGLYALAARNEWARHRERTPDEKYQRYFDHFDPDLYDPRDWAARAEAAGAQYVVVTAKHHEGFCLWDTDLTDFSAAHTPYGRDLLTPLVDALRERGLGVGLYYSLIDWHHPQFPIDGLHPLRDDQRRWPVRRGATSRGTGSTCTGRCASCSPGSVRSTSCGSTSPIPTTSTRARRCGAARVRTTGEARTCWRWCAGFSPARW